MSRPLEHIRTIYEPVLNLQRGDWVRKYLAQDVISPYIGVVTNVVPSIGVVDVEWPFGNKREEAYFLTKLNKEQTVEVPTVFGDTSYSSYDNP